MRKIRYIVPKTWSQFRNTGLLWYINSILHLFGWAICIDYKDVKKGIIKGAYPARCKFRGFNKENLRYLDVTKYLKKNIKSLERDCKL